LRVDKKLIDISEGLTVIGKKYLMNRVNAFEFLWTQI